MGFIRIKNKTTGSEYTVADTTLLGDDVSVVDKPATDRTGKPLPAKHKTDVGATAPAAPKKAEKTSAAIPTQE